MLSAKASQRNRSSVSRDGKPTLQLVDFSTKCYVCDMKSQIFTDAHTAYSFTDEPVSDAQLEEIYELMKFAPTPMNSQSLRITFIRTEEGKARLLPHLAEFNRHKSQSAAAVAVLAFDTDFHERLIEHFPHNPGAKDNFSDPIARAQSAQEIATLQAGYFILAVRAVGLDAGPMAGFSKEGVDGEFFAGTTMKSLYIVNIGHVAPDGNFPRNPRLSAQDALTWY